MSDSPFTAALKDPILLASLGLVFAFLIVGGNVSATPF
jgi:hypothetical protein